MALVTYAGATRVVLPPTGMDGKDRILAAIDELGAGGSTAMASGLDLAYSQAMLGLEPGVTSRVIVCTDGDTNVGPTGMADIQRIIASRAKAGITLSTVGFGMVDFDPAQVAKYRLVGYENRTIADDDFRKDAVDAGEIGPGHQVTAMYELELTPQARLVPAPLGMVRIRHKAPEGSEVATERTFAMMAPPAASFAAAAPDLQFAFAVSAFADLLRGQDDARRWSLEAIEQVARATAGDDPDRNEFVALIDKARRLRGSAATVAR